MPVLVLLLQAAWLSAPSTCLGASTVACKHPVSSFSLVSWPWLLGAAGSDPDQPADRNTTVQGIAQHPCSTALSASTEKRCQGWTQSWPKWGNFTVPCLCDTPGARVNQKGKTSCPAQWHQYILSCLWVCCSLSLYRHMNVDMTVTRFLFDCWLFRIEVVGQVILLLHSGNQDKFGGLGRKSNTMC